MKVIEDILKEVDQEVLRKAPHAQRKYNKITDSLRNRFLQKIFQENKSIKKAAEELNINYSSAKTILTVHRKKSKSTNDLAGLTGATNQAANASTAEFASPMQRTLPPKYLSKPSFMSTASNLSELKEGEDSNSENQSDEKNLQMLQSFNKPLISQNFNMIKPQNVSNFPKPATSSTLSPLSSLNFQSTTSIPFQFNSAITNSLQIGNSSPFTPTQENLNLNTSAAATVPPLSQNLLAQIQQQIQVQQQQQQQQQQQLQNTLQQLLILQNALLAQSTQQQQPSQPPQPIQAALTQMLLQQQLLLMNPTQPQNTSQTPPSWI